MSLSSRSPPAVLIISPCAVAGGVMGPRSSGGDGARALCSAGHRSSALTSVIKGIYSIIQFDYRQAAG